MIINNRFLSLYDYKETKKMKQKKVKEKILLKRKLFWKERETNNWFQSSFVNRWTFLWKKGDKNFIEREYCYEAEIGSVTLWNDFQMNTKMTFKEETEDVITMKSCCSKVKKNERRNERRTRICVYKPILFLNQMLIQRNDWEKDIPPMKERTFGYEREIVGLTFIIFLVG